VRDSWTALDWKAYFDERAGIREYEGGFDRPTAERLALDDTIAHWMSVHLPPPTAPGECASCTSSLENDLLPVLAEAGHTWVHLCCWTAWESARKREAAAYLSRMGLLPPKCEEQ
jgi:hypothetical protein